MVYIQNDLIIGYTTQTLWLFVRVERMELWKISKACMFSLLDYQNYISLIWTNNGEKRNGYSHSPSFRYWSCWLPPFFSFLFSFFFWLVGCLFLCFFFFFRLITTYSPMVWAKFKMSTCDLKFDTLPTWN